MGQKPSTGSSQVTGTNDPEQIREEIEETREQLGDTVEALAAKTDVKAQAKQKLRHTKATVSERTEQLAGQAKEVSPESATAAAAQASRKARENPLPVAAIGAFVIGFLAGRLTKR
jgi:ElaB/YqjD/DUF883 family membrane-anchored ribosome-binding protein